MLKNIFNEANSVGSYFETPRNGNLKAKTMQKLNKFKTAIEQEIK